MYNIKNHTVSHITTLAHMLLHSNPQSPPTSKSLKVDSCTSKTPKGSPLLKPDVVLSVVVGLRLQGLNLDAQGFLRASVSTVNSTSRQQLSTTTVRRESSAVDDADVSPTVIADANVTQHVRHVGEFEVGT